MLQNELQYFGDKIPQQEDNTDLDDEEVEQDEQRPAAVNSSEYIGTLVSRRLDTQSRQETEIGKPAISNQSVFYKHRRNMSSFDNSRMEMDSRNMTQVLGYGSLNNDAFDKDQLLEALQREAEENEQMMIANGHLF